MEWLLEVGEFAAKAVVVTIALLVVSAFIARLVARGRSDEGQLRVRALHDRIEGMIATVQHAVLERRPFKQQLARTRQLAKVRRASGRNLYVLDFKGDLSASAVARLRNELTAVLGAATAQDEVVLRLESSGGMVHAYGLAASELMRVRDKKIRLTACVDRVAASGGYMMACVADQIIAAPFAIIGSIGVVAAVPNLHRLLAKHAVDYEEMTAGEYKRTVSFLGEISSEGRKKFQQQLEETHGLFKDFVRERRKNADIDKLSTGEYWYGKRAAELGLADSLSTSDDYLVARMQEVRVFHVSYTPAHRLKQRLSGVLSTAGERLATRLWERATDSWMPRA